MSERLAQFIVFFPVFLFSLSFHEASHAWTANRLGDPTARLLGRMTLNPLAHIDWIGTVLFPMMMFLMPGLLLFGWAKPVPVNPLNLRGGRQGNLKVAAAGPVSNIFLVIVFAGIMHLMIAMIKPFPMEGILLQILETGVSIGLSRSPPPTAMSTWELSSIFTFPRMAQVGAVLFFISKPVSGMRGTFVPSPLMPRGKRFMWRQTRGFMCEAATAH